MAAEMGISEATVRRIWHAHGLKPYLVESFKISKDKRFAEKLEVKWTPETGQFLAASSVESKPG